MADRVIWMVMVEEHDGTTTRELEIKAFTTLDAAIECVNNHSELFLSLDDGTDWANPDQYAWSWKTKSDVSETDINMLRMRLLDRDDPNERNDDNGGTGREG